MLRVAINIRHLVEDENVTFNGFYEGDRRATLRLRVWHGKDATPLVLASRVYDPTQQMASPFNWSCRAANYANQCILRHPLHGMLYFEDDLQTVNQVHFGFFGNVNRLRFYRPQKVTKPWSVIESLVGSPVER